MGLSSCLAFGSSIDALLSYRYSLSTAINGIAGPGTSDPGECAAHAKAMMRDFAPPAGQQPRDITIYRGQKDWDKAKYRTNPRYITAASMRRSWGSSTDMEQWTDTLLTGYRHTLRDAGTGNAQAIKRLGSMLLNAQLYAYENPFISCSFSQAIALSFALAGDTDGFVLTIDGDWYDGVDFEFLRRRFGYVGTAVDHLQEFGIGKELHPPFHVVRVVRVGLSQAPQQVYP